MYKLRLLPDTTGFTITAGQSTISTMLNGGAPRVRLDQLGAVFTVTCQWSVGPSDFDYLATFFRAGTVYGALPFQIDLLGAEGSTLTTYTAIFIPGTWKLLSQTGLTYVQGASFWAIPTASINSSGVLTCADRALLAQYASAGQSFAWAFAATVTPATSTVNGSATGDLCSADVYQSHGESIAQGTFGITWTNFVMPTLPAGASITGLFPVMVASDMGTGATIQSGGYGTGVSINTAGNGVSGTNLIPLFSYTNGPIDNQTYQGSPSIGTALPSGFGMFAYTEQTINAAMAAHLHIDFVAVAVAYV